MLAALAAAAASARISPASRGHPAPRLRSATAPWAGRGSGDRAPPPCSKPKGCRRTGERGRCTPPAPTSLQSCAPPAVAPPSCLTPLLRYQLPCWWWWCCCLPVAVSRWIPCRLSGSCTRGEVLVEVVVEEVCVCWGGVWRRGAGGGGAVTEEIDDDERLCFGLT